MSVDFDSVWHIVGLLASIGSLIFYAARTLGKTVEQIERLQQALEVVKTEVVQNSAVCRDGRIELWTEVNKLRERVAKVETLQEHQMKTKD